MVNGFQIIINLENCLQSAKGTIESLHFKQPFNSFIQLYSAAPPPKPKESSSIDSGNDTEQEDSTVSTLSRRTDGTLNVR